MEKEYTEKGLHVFSGTVLMGKVGEETDIVTTSGEKLFIGDIVVVQNHNEYSSNSIHGLSTVVWDKTTSYTSGKHEITNQNHRCFVMGLAGVDLTEPHEEWIITKVKSYKDVIPSERWVDYGFNYKEL